MSEFIRNVKRIIPGRTTNVMMFVVIGLWITAMVGIIWAVM